jgi:hypothetical protein
MDGINIHLDFLTYDPHLRCCDALIDTVWLLRSLGPPPQRLVEIGSVVENCDTSKVLSFKNRVQISIIFEDFK